MIFVIQWSKILIINLKYLPEVKCFAIFLLNDHMIRTSRTPITRAYPGRWFQSHLLTVKKGGIRIFPNQQVMQGVIDLISARLSCQNDGNLFTI